MDLKNFINKIICADAKDILPQIPANSIDLIITSPPYADKRNSVYDTVPADRYVEWFLPIADELKRILRDSGSFVLNIKEKAEKGERHTYVIELILEMKKKGWLWVEEYIWHKKNCYPGKWPNRFRDAWERCLHFTKQKKFKMYQENVMIPIGDWVQERLKNLSERDKIRFESRSKSGFGKNISNWLVRDKVYPTNVLHLATECSNKNHSATFPLALPMWFIKLFTEEGDVVLDPFIGSGTTAIACLQLNRKYIGIEIKEEYCKLAMEQIKYQEKPNLFSTVA
jgi:DNA modification methylase